MTPCSRITFVFCCWGRGCCFSLLSVAGVVAAVSAVVSGIAVAAVAADIVATKVAVTSDLATRLPMHKVRLHLTPRPRGSRRQCKGSDETPTKSHEADTNMPYDATHRRQDRRSTRGCSNGLLFVR